MKCNQPGAGSKHDRTFSAFNRSASDPGHATGEHERAITEHDPVTSKHGHEADEYGQTSLFATLCDTLHAIGQTRSAREKSHLFSSYLQSLTTEADIDLAVRFTAEGAFPSREKRRTVVGRQTVALTAADFCGIDYDQVYKPCRNAAGSASEAIEKLMSNLPEAVNRRSPAALTLHRVAQGFSELAHARNREDKQAVLAGLWELMKPREIRYMIRIMDRRPPGIGFGLYNILEAVSMAFRADSGQVRRTHMLTGSMGITAVMAQNRTLDTAVFHMFQPVAFMLASASENVGVLDPKAFVAEEKIDGLRTQAHISDDRVSLFSREMNDITPLFPDVTDALGTKDAEMVLDGEICIFENGSVKPLLRLQKRMEEKKPDERLLASQPALFIAFDLLFLNGVPVIDQPLHQRRQLLEQICRRQGIPLLRQYFLKDTGDITRIFKRAIRHGSKGLILKQRDSRYEYGQRSPLWFKFKESCGSLDTVIMYAHSGYAHSGGGKLFSAGSGHDQQGDMEPPAAVGRQGNTYSGFTLGIRVDDDERYEEAFIPIGKATVAFADEEADKMSQRIRELLVERFGPTFSLRPGIVVELEFDSIEVNRRTKAGYVLHRPRFRIIHWDRDPHTTHTLKDVERLYQRQSREPAPRKPGENPVQLFSGPSS